jgi:RNA polymerase-binding transcription factor DksA
MQEKTMATDQQWRCDDSGLRAMLEARRRELTNDLQLRITRIRANGFDAAPELDDGDPYDLDVRLLEIAEATLHRVEFAIARLDEGRYGRCTRCGAEIGEKRLQAVPFALCCRPCEMARENEAVRRPLFRRRLWIEGAGEGRPVGWDGE